MDPVLGIITMFGGTFAPRGWAMCQGQILSIAQNTALFTILGTTYGGNGQTTFALPDLRGRTPVHPGSGPGTSNFSLGQVSGQEYVTLLLSNLPAHTHTGTLTMGVSTVAATTDEPIGGVPAVGSVNSWQQGATPDGQLGGTSAAVQPAGGGQPFTIRQPYLAINFIIALEGIFPSRN
jgi:microcystin-dependent protein